MSTIGLRHAVPVALAAAAITSRASAQSPERVALAGDAAIYNLAGTVKLVAGSGRDIVVDVTRRGRDAGRLKVESGDVRGRRALRVVYPDDDLVYPAMRRDRVMLRVGSDGTFDDGNGRGFFSSHQISIRGSGRGTEAWADLTVAVPTGANLVLHLAVGDATVSNVDGDLTLDVDAATVTTERTRGRLAVDGGSGDVRIAGAQGDVDLDLGSGSVDLRDVAATNLKVDGGSGSLTGTNVSAPTIDLDLGSGGARLAKVTTRSLRLDSGSGGVDIELTSDVDDVRVDSGSGSVTLRIPPTLGASIDVDTGSGGIETQVPIQLTRKERDHLTGTIGDGKGRIVIDGGSGSVRLLKTS